MRALLIFLAATTITPAHAQWAPHSDISRCIGSSGYIKVEGRVACVGHPLGVSGGGDALALAGLPPLSEAMRSCDTLHDDPDDYSTRMYCRKRTKENDYPAVKAAVAANPESMHIKRCISGAFKNTKTWKGFYASDAYSCIKRGVQ